MSPHSPGSYVWDAAVTGGKYAFSVYGPDGFVTSFAGDGGARRPQRRPGPGRHRGPAVHGGRAHAGQRGPTAIVYTVTKNDYEGRTTKVTVQGGSARTVSWPASQDGYYDVVITANTSDGFRRRYAGRIA